MTSLENAAQPRAAAAAMEIDSLMPHFDATRIEHRIIKGSSAEVYAAVQNADFVRTWKEKRAVGTLFALRTAAERLACRVRGREFRQPDEPASMRLADLTASGEWVLLGERPGSEICFGTIGRFWGGETTWRQSTSTEFREFSEPDYARIACSFSLRPYGEDRTLVTYEARTHATDARARAAFLRYWRVVAPFAGVVMRAQLSVVAEETRTAAGLVE
jgi:hypothetical protein